MPLGKDAQASPRAIPSESQLGQYEPLFPSAKQDAKELVFKPGIWIDGDLRERLTR
jgi:hypothetical protein